MAKTSVIMIKELSNFFNRNSAFIDFKEYHCVRKMIVASAKNIEITRPDITSINTVDVNATNHMNCNF